jgi:succinyl-CoA synthetase beta subunit
MPRVKLTEYQAKRILLGDSYNGVSFSSGESPTLSLSGPFVVKVDQGIKKRMKQGLLALNVAGKDCAQATKEWEGKGFSNFIVEPMFPHDASEERYVSFERVRDGIRILYAREGGIEIEEHPEKVETFFIRGEEDARVVSEKNEIPRTLIGSVLQAFEKEYFAFLEINPLVIQNGEAHLLDAAVLVDSAAQFFANGWNAGDIVKQAKKHPREAAVEALAETTPASLKLNVINPDGSLYFLLSGGGGSIVIADEAELLGQGKEIANYGEYSGGPTREETYLYAKEVLSLMLASPAPKKALVIAGGVANFTDVKTTFGGIIDALTEHADALRAGNVRIFIRRGGPNEKEGLALMEAFLEKEQLLGSVHGSDAVITSAVDDAIAYLKS